MKILKFLGWWVSLTFAGVLGVAALECWRSGYYVSMAFALWSLGIPAAMIWSLLVEDWD